MARATQLERIKYILNLLFLGTQSIETILSTFTREGMSVSSRQIYRDLADLEKSFLRDGETLVVKIDGNKKTWELVHDANAERIKDFDLITLLLSRSTSPACLDGRKQSFNNIYRLLTDHLNNSHLNRYLQLDKNLGNTHFYEVFAKMDYQKHLDTLLWVCGAPYKMIITEFEGDAVSNYKSLSLPFHFIPLKTMYHRGSFFIGGLIDNNEMQPLFLDAHQIIKFETPSYQPSKKRLLNTLNKELDKRFGVSQNINGNVYSIEIEFSCTTGLYVKELHWHHSQEFRQLTNGNFLMKLTCGINRELVGWIFQWMGNVKVIGPIILKELYEQQLDKMSALHQGGYLTYSNIFQPK